MAANVFFIITGLFNGKGKAAFHNCTSIVKQMKYILIPINYGHLILWRGEFAERDGSKGPSSEEFIRVIVLV